MDKVLGILSLLQELSVFYWKTEFKKALVYPCQNTLLSTSPPRPNARWKREKLRLNLYAAGKMRWVSVVEFAYIAWRLWKRVVTYWESKLVIKCIYAFMITCYQPSPKVYSVFLETLESVENSSALNNLCKTSTHKKKLYLWWLMGKVVFL